MTGVLSGYAPNATAMIASQVPRQRSGWALGTLATGGVAGNLIGPLIGGMLAQWFGLRNVFIITGVILLICTFLTVFMVKENFQPIEKEDVISMAELRKRINYMPILIGLFISSLILQVGATSISPILTLYIRDLSGSSSNALVISGLFQSLGFQQLLPHQRWVKSEIKSGITKSCWQV